MSTGLWAVVPAAGRGERVGGAVPKQYQPLAGRPMLAHTLDKLLAVEAIGAVVVATAPGDDHFEALAAGYGGRVVAVEGGAERSDSVLAGLRHAAAHGDPRALVVVHDAARPCVRPADVARLIETARGHEAGAVLAAPVRDTMKRAGADGAVAQTVERRGLWHALTPQVFVLQSLIEALEAAAAAGVTVTDESQAMERLGLRPLLEQGHHDNIKVTDPLDRRLAEMLLRLESEDA